MVIDYLKNFSNALESEYFPETKTIKICKNIKQKKCFGYKGSISHDKFFFGYFDSKDTLTEKLELQGIMRERNILKIGYFNENL